MSDAAYMDAVRRGDMATAQRMVDEAAKAAGYTVGPVYHSTTYGGGLTSFDTKSGAFGKAGYGSYFSNEAGAKLFAEYGDKFQSQFDYMGRPKNQKIFKVYLKMKKPLKVDHVDDLSPYLDAGQTFGVYRKYQKNKPNELTKAERMGYDGIITAETTSKKVHKTQGLKILDRNDPNGFIFPVYVVFSPTQIKSADSVTYDDSGNVVPLSQRFDDRSKDIRNPYTRPDLRERLKRKIMAGDKGGRPGEWSARKAQLLAAEYEKAGGGYTGSRSKAQRSLSRWTKQDWRTKSGKPSLETGERYLPAAAIKALSSAEYAESTRTKRKASGQFSKQPKRIAMKTKRYRNPMQSRPFWEMTQQEYIQATGMPKQASPWSPDYAEYEKWRRTNVPYFEMLEKASREGKRIPDAIVASLPAGVRSRVKAELPKTEKEFNRKYVIHGSKSCLDFIEPRIGDFTREAYSGSGEGTFEEMGGKEYAYFRNPEDIELVLQYAGSSGCVMVSQMPGDALFVKEDGLYNEYGELVSQDVGIGPEDGDIISEQGAGVLFQIPVEQWKKSGEKSIYSYLKKKMRGTITNPMTSTVRKKLAPVIEPDDRILCYDTASGEDFYRLWDIIHTGMPMTEEALVEVEGMLDDDGVLVIESGESPAGLQDHFRKATRYNGLLLVQGPKNPENARIETEKLRRELE